MRRQKKSVSSLLIIPEWNSANRQKRAIRQASFEDRDGSKHRVMIREYLKQSRGFRKVFALPLKIREQLRHQHRQFEDWYDETVVGGTLIVKPQNLKGAFAVPATSHLASRVVRTGQYEPEISALLGKWSHLEGHVVNIGANVGFFAIHIAQTFSKCQGVFAIEPNPSAYSLLLENIAQNNVGDKVKPIQMCIGDSEGEVDFAVIEGMPEFSSISAIVHPTVAEYPQTIIRVHVATLDKILGGAKTSFLMIDTEGAEYLVFKGSEQLIRREMPILLFECADTLLQKFGGTSMQLEKLVQSFGYVVRDALAPKMPLKHPFNGEAIAVPAGREHELSS